MCAFKKKLIKQILMKIKLIRFIKETLYLIFGLFICSYFLYLRVFKERTSYTIDFSFNIWRFILYFVIVIFFIYLLVKKIYPRESKNKIIIQFKEYVLAPIKKTYDTSLIKVYEFLFLTLKIKAIDSFLHFLSKGISIIFYNDSIYFRVFFFYLVMVLPIFIMLFLLCIDVIYFHQYNYVLLGFWLLIIPLLWKVIYFLVNEYYNHCWNFLNIIFDIQLQENSLYFRRKANLEKSPLFNGNFFDLEKMLLNYESDIRMFFIINTCYLKEFSENGPLMSSPSYRLIQIVRIFGYLIVFFYILLKMFLNLF